MDEGFMHKCMRRARVARENLRDLGQEWYLRTGPEPPASTAPNFLIIGAMKAGTTALHNCLARHPDIFMCYVKEPSYFLDNPTWVLDSNVRTRERLCKLMYRGYANERRVGESSTTYTEAPTLGAEAPANIHAQAPEMQFIYMIRNPLARIVSHYLHCVERGLYTESIDVMVVKDPSLLERSLYFSQVRRYLKYFDRQQFLFLYFEEFIKDPSAPLNETCRFLGVTERSDLQLDAKTQNKTRVPPRIREENARFDETTFEYLMSHIRKDMQALEELLEQPLSHWDLAKSRWCRRGTARE